MFHIKMIKIGIWSRCCKTMILIEKERNVYYRVIHGGE
jgi:hypothetical protein